MLILYKNLSNFSFLIVLRVFSQVINFFLFIFQLFFYEVSSRHVIYCFYRVTLVFMTEKCLQKNFIFICICFNINIQNSFHFLTVKLLSPVSDLICYYIRYCYYLFIQVLFIVCIASTLIFDFISPNIFYFLPVLSLIFYITGAFLSMSHIMQVKSNLILLFISIPIPIDFFSLLSFINLMSLLIFYESNFMFSANLVTLLYQLKYLLASLVVFCAYQVKR